MSNSEYSSVVLSVPGVSCAHCERTVKSALEPVAGVREVTVDIPGKTVQVRYDPDLVAVGRLSGILADEGYPVAEIA